jgi:hypothetical protein
MDLAVFWGKQRTCGARSAVVAKPFPHALRVASHSTIFTVLASACRLRRAAAPRHVRRIAGHGKQ